MLHEINCFQINTFAITDRIKWDKERKDLSEKLSQKMLEIQNLQATIDINTDKKTDTEFKCLGQGADRGFYAFGKQVLLVQLAFLVHKVIFSHNILYVLHFMEIEPEAGRPMQKGKDQQG